MVKTCKSRCVSHAAPACAVSCAPEVGATTVRTTSPSTTIMTQKWQAERSVKTAKGSTHAAKVVTGLVAPRPYHDAAYVQAAPLDYVGAAGQSGTAQSGASSSAGTPVTESHAGQLVPKANSVVSLPMKGGYEQTNYCMNAAARHISTAQSIRPDNRL